MKEKYIPLYRKYRPQMLEEIVGQGHIKNALTNAIELDKISHAYLFTGPRGTGKTSTARIFAMSLNCKNGPTANPCGECEICQNIKNSIPIDVIEIDAASNRKVEDAQHILEKVGIPPLHSRFKIYIIDEVHMLSTTAFNALLKTLEEPPKNVIFILATTEVHKVLDTIKSRCQRFDFKRITTSDIVEHLKNISKKENINITEDALLAIAKNSAGGMRDSIALLDQLSILGGKDAINCEDINNLLGRLSFDTLHKLVESIINSQPQDAIEDLEVIYNKGNEPVQILSNLMDYLKNLLIVKNCREEIICELTQLADEQNNSLKSQAQNIETNQIVFLIEKCSDYIKELKLTNNPRLWLEVAIIDLANLAENTSLLKLQERISRLESGAPVQMSSAAYKTPPAPVLKPEIKSAPVPKIEPVQEKTTAKPEPVEEVKVESAAKEDVNLKVEEKPAQELEPKSEDFAPMPKSKPASQSGADINEAWAKLLECVQSAPTRALLKQWANPVIITPENVVITMKNEVLLKQFVEGNKREMLINAVNSLFGQQDSKVLVRLPQPDDAVLKQSEAAVTVPKSQTPPPSQVPEPQKEETPTSEEVDELKEEMVETENATVVLSASISSMHSDQVNMVVDLFDGKMID